MSDVSQIDGNAVRLRRESQGLGLNDVATRACLSVKQVRQIEEGGMTAFYSETVKLTAARKVAGLLSMNEAELFGQPLLVAESHMAYPEDLATLEIEAPVVVASHVAFGGGLNAQHAAITRSEVLHELAQPPEFVEEETTASLDKPHEEHPSTLNLPETGIEKPTEPSVAAIDTSHQAIHATPQSVSTEEAESTSGGYFLKIMALFVVALAAAALLKPNAVEEKPAAPVSELPAAPVPPMVNPVDTASPAQPSAPATAENKPTDAKPVAAEVKADATPPKAADTKPAKPLNKPTEAQAINPAPAAETPAGK